MLTRWRALALDAYLIEGEHPSSPVGKAFGCPEPFFLVDDAKLLSVSCAAKKATSVDTWRLVWGEIGSRSSLREALELMGTALDAPGSPC